MRFWFLCVLVLFVARSASADGSVSQDECADAENTVSMITCISHSYEKLEVKRLALEDKAAQAAEEYDLYVEEEESRKGRSVDQGEVARKSFEAYRHDECKRQAYLSGAGTTATLGRVACQIQLTQQRIEILEQEER